LLTDLKRKEKRGVSPHSQYEKGGQPQRGEGVTPNKRERVMRDHSFSKDTERGGGRRKPQGVEHKKKKIITKR